MILDKFKLVSLEKIVGNRYYSVEIDSLLARKYWINIRLQYSLTMGVHGFEPWTPAL